MIRQFLLALQFLSTLPVRFRGTIQNKDLAASMAYFPVVGGLLGGLSALICWGLLHFFPSIVAIVGAVVSLIILSGALHLDGFADMCDGFYGGRDRAKVLAIMKDSHVGAMAVIGVFCLLALKIAFITTLDQAMILRALVVMPAIGRWTMVWHGARSHYARDDGGTGLAYIGQVPGTALLAATLSCACLAAALLGWRGLVALSLAAAAAEGFRRSVERRIGGMTGDTLGACSEFTEVLVLAVLSFQWPGLPR